MKKFAVLAVFAAVSVSAQAQSAVTLFGTLDVNARYVKNGDNSLKSLSSDGATTSRFGVRGVEDLGDGLQAGFWLESSVKADEGVAGEAARFWNRRSTVSILSNFGEVRLGRDTVPTYTGSSDYDVFSTAGVATGDKFTTSPPAKLGTAVETLKRADNQISYFTPNSLGGFYGRASVAAGEGTAGKKYIGGRAGYAKGPLDASLSYGQTTVAPASTGDDKYNMFVLGASYDFSVVKLSGYYTQSKFAGQKLAVYNLGAQAPVSQAGVVRVSYVNANASGAATDSNDASQLAVGYLHNLSKRTSLYATVARVNNKGNAVYNVVSSTALPSLAAGQSSTGYEFGVRHTF